MEFIADHKHEFGVEPICRTLTQAGTKIAPSTYYAAKSRPPSARARRDEELMAEIRRVHEDNYGVYGARKVHVELVREGITVTRCTVERLMRAAGLRGVSGAKGPRTTVPGRGPDDRPDLVERDFTASAPNELWVADIPPQAGGAPHLLQDLRGLGVRGVRHRRLLATCRGLAGIDIVAHRPGVGRPGDGALGPPA